MDTTESKIILSDPEALSDYLTAGIRGGGTTEATARAAVCHGMARLSHLLAEQPGLAAVGAALGAAAAIALSEGDRGQIWPLLRGWSEAASLEGQALDAPEGERASLLARAADVCRAAALEASKGEDAVEAYLAGRMAEDREDLAALELGAGGEGELGEDLAGEGARA